METAEQKRRKQYILWGSVLGFLALALLIGGYFLWMRNRKPPPPPPPPPPPTVSGVDDDEEAAVAAAAAAAAAKEAEDAATFGAETRLVTDAAAAEGAAAAALAAEQERQRLEAQAAAEAAAAAAAAIIPPPMTVIFKTAHNKVVSLLPSGAAVGAPSDVPLDEGAFITVVFRSPANALPNGGTKVALLSSATGKYVHMINQGCGQLFSGSAAVEPGPAEIFVLYKHADETYTLQSHACGKYVAFEPSGRAIADRSAVAGWEKFTMRMVDDLELVGPGGEGGGGGGGGTTPVSSADKSILGHPPGSTPAPVDVYIRVSAQPSVYLLVTPMGGVGFVSTTSPGLGNIITLHFQTSVAALPNGGTRVQLVGANKYLSVVGGAKRVDASATVANDYTGFVLYPLQERGKYAIQSTSVAAPGHFLEYDVSSDAAYARSLDIGLWQTFKVELVGA